MTERVIPSSGNVFADMGLPDAAELDTKVRLGAAICRIVGRHRQTQVEVANTLGISQPKVSALLHYKLKGFSLERLMRFLVVLGQDAEILVRAKPRSRSAASPSERPGPMEFLRIGFSGIGRGC
jgi:predicted XRE-type DNA-binding protein